MKKEKVNRYDLEIMKTKNGTILLLSEIGIFPVKKDDQVMGHKCKALVDTGAECTLVDERIINLIMPNLDKEKMHFDKIKLVDDSVIEIMKVPLYIRYPNSNQNVVKVEAFVQKMRKSEYYAILGMDILKNLSLNVDIENGEAYVMY